MASSNAFLFWLSEVAKLTTCGIPTWSPTELLTARVAENRGSRQVSRVLSDPDTEVEFRLDIDYAHVIFTKPPNHPMLTLCLPYQPPQTPTASRPPLAKDDTGSLKFTSIMNNLQHAYPKQQLADISTSYGFICLLHLANEKGLVIENVDGWRDLTVRRDFEAVVGEGDL